MTLTMSIKLICILELAIVSILILQAPDLLHRTTNNHFYVTDGTFALFSIPLFLLEMFSKFYSQTRMATGPSFRPGPGFSNNGRPGATQHSIIFFTILFLNL